MRSHKVYGILNQKHLMKRHRIICSKGLGEIISRKKPVNWCEKSQIIIIIIIIIYFNDLEWGMKAKCLFNRIIFQPLFNNNKYEFIACSRDENYFFLIVIFSFHYFSFISFWEFTGKFVERGKWTKEKPQPVDFPLYFPFYLLHKRLG